LCLGSGDAERRIVLREGDVVTASSSLDDESLVAFLVQRGDLPKETARRLGAKCPPFGRHAAAALIARGYLRQDQMWDVLRAHAEWLLARIFPLAQARFSVEALPPGRLATEPSVFGASPGAEVFVEVVRRVVSPADAIERLGGQESRVAAGPAARLLEECALAPPALDRLREAVGRPLSEVLDATPEGDLATVVFALSQLGVVEVLRSVGDRPARGGVSAGGERAADIAALDGDALRERVQARMQLVEDGDYFALLGVPRDATGYEIRRAFLELRRGLDPSRVLTPDVADLDADLRKIVIVLEEAYEILKDAARRERYRLAIES
ncbi:MAG: J domain-containing protein, partial [Myxococcota bacterium]|nr:J domain-containing protein [Myxococcota bacterium]